MFNVFVLLFYYEVLLNLFYIFRFIKVRKYDVKKVVEMWKNMLVWCMEFGIDIIDEVCIKCFFIDLEGLYEICICCKFI